MKTLIAVVNARSRSDWRNAIRSTWLPQVPRDRADVFFFVGRGEPLDYPEGVIELDCSDKYEHLPEKIRAISKWALEREYEYMLKLDDDVVVRPTSLLCSEYERYDYTGRSNRPESAYPIPYGFSYWLSKKCMSIVSQAALPGDGSNDDEKWVAFNLSQKGIRMRDDRRYFLHQWRLPDPEPLSRRPLRAPKRPVVVLPDPFGQTPGTFAWCVHLSVEQEDKIKEFHKLFSMYGEK